MKNTRHIYLFDLVSDNNGRPKLEIIKEKEIHKSFDGEDLSYSGARETVLTLCEMTNIQKSFNENEYLALYNYNKELIGFAHIATGGLTELAVSRRKKATYILLSGAFYFVVIHNHPNITELHLKDPSEGDIRAIQGDKFLASMLEVNYVANYIITKTGFRCVDDNDDYEFDDIDYKWINKEV